MTPVGPVTAAPNVSIDDAHLIWVYWGTGHYYGDVDQSNTDTQYFFGVKDPVLTGGCAQTTVTNCQQNNLVDISSAVVCSVCVAPVDEVTGVLGAATFSALQNLVKSSDGWFTTLAISGERSLSRATVLGGTVLFTTFIPTTGNICNSIGNGRLYGLLYMTGSAYKESVLGTESAGANTNLSRVIVLGAGLPSQLGVHVGAQGNAANGTVGSTTGCNGRLTLYDGRNSAVDGTCAKPALTMWSRMISWRDL
jgi:type IV pilus assembly protein PilY1